MSITVTDSLGKRDLVSFIRSEATRGKSVPVYEAWSTYPHSVYERERMRKMKAEDPERYRATLKKKAERDKRNRALKAVERKQRVLPGQVPVMCPHCKAVFYSAAVCRMKCKECKTAFNHRMHRVV